MEKFFTMQFDKFKTAYLKSEPVSLVPKQPWEEAYRYAMVCRRFCAPRKSCALDVSSYASVSQHNRFLMRSQLDCHSSLLPGSGVFDIKTRAAVPVRYDLRRYRASHRCYCYASLESH